MYVCRQALALVFGGWDLKERRVTVVVTVVPEIENDRERRRPIGFDGNTYCRVVLLLHAHVGMGRPLILTMVS